MIVVGQKERATQDRVARLFVSLGYDHLGDWSNRKNNCNVEPELLANWLNDRGVDSTLAARAVAQFTQVCNDATRHLYDRNRAAYQLLRYGVKVKPGAGEATVTVWLIDWKNPGVNHFAIAEEVTVVAADARAAGKRPDIVIYINGIALGVLELKRSTVSVAEGIRQNLDNQKRDFIAPFFATMQLVMAGNDTEGLRYGTTATPERYYLKWAEETFPELNPLDRALTQLCDKSRLLELLHDFVVFDCGVKKLCRHNQFFGVRAAQLFARRREGGVVWHTQGSGKSLTMVWLAKWLRENVPGARVLLVTDRTELDEQIAGVFRGVDEEIVRAKSGAELATLLAAATPWLMCGLVHKFGGRDEAEQAEAVRAAFPQGFRPAGELFVFVDECHRTQSGELHKAMNAVLPGATFIGFTGTPLLKDDKAKSVETFGRYIHTYKFDEAVRDKVVLDLRYEARAVHQELASPTKVDEWFEAKTRGLTDLAKARLRQRWGSLRKVLSSHERLTRIVADITLDFDTKPRLADGRGNALLVAGSIFQACKYYELFAGTELRGKCAVVTSYEPTAASVKGEETGEGVAERIAQYTTYRKMLAEWFDEPEEAAALKVAEFETEVKRRFVREPGRLRLLIVVDKLLTGFDAPPATYLYIDKAMRDHALFQAICRVNRLDGDDKEYGYVVDYKDLFKSLSGAVGDYTSGALDGYDAADVSGLLEDRLAKGRERLGEELEQVRALFEPVGDARDGTRCRRYFCGETPGDLKATAPRRAALYKLVPALVRAYAAIAGELDAAGYSEAEAAELKREVARFEAAHAEIKAASGDAIDLKLYDPAMRQLIDNYVRAGESERVSALGDLTLVELLVTRGPEAVVAALPEGLRDSDDAVAETIENNVRQVIIDETPVNPKYYESLAALLNALVAGRRTASIGYAEYLRKVTELARGLAGPAGEHYPAGLTQPRVRALYDNLGRDEALARRVDAAVAASRQDGWRGNPVKQRKVRAALKSVLIDDERVEAVLGIVTSRDEY